MGKNSRQIEHDAAVAAGKNRKFSGGIDPRVGGKPKTASGAPAAYGMLHKNADTEQFHQGVSSTQISAAFSEAAGLERDPLSRPPIGKNLAPAKVAFGQSEQSTDSITRAHVLNGKSLAEHGHDVLREATRNAGDHVTHPDLRSDKPAHLELGERLLAGTRGTFKTLQDAQRRKKS